MTKVIHNPALANIEDHSATSATFNVEPLHAGYGNTLGNSLRRVLLSSIEGSAIVAFRIEGASHEFTTIPGVKEDVIDIMLNIKNIRVKAFSDKPIELRLEKKGSGIVTAADIKTVDDVEIVNPDQIICTIDDPKKSVLIDFVIETGRGYQSIEDSSAQRIHSDMIAVDAIFSPVLRVRYKVDNTRVGQEMNLDKLFLTIDTSGRAAPGGFLSGVKNKNERKKPPGTRAAPGDRPCRGTPPHRGAGLAEGAGTFEPRHGPLATGGGGHARRDGRAARDGPEGRRPVPGGAGQAGIRPDFREQRPFEDLPPGRLA